MRTEIRSPFGEYLGHSDGYKLDAVGVDLYSDTLWFASGELQSPSAMIALPAVMRTLSGDPKPEQPIYQPNRRARRAAARRSSRDR